PAFQAGKSLNILTIGGVRLYTDFTKEAGTLSASPPSVDNYICHASRLELWLDQSVSLIFPLIHHIYLEGLGVAEYIKAVSQKFHLDTCLFCIHRLDSKPFAPCNSNSFMIIRIFLKEFISKCTDSFALAGYLGLIFAD